MPLFRFPILHLVRTIVVSIAIGCVSTLWSQSAHSGFAAGLIERSPFLPPGMPPPNVERPTPAATVAPGNYEFRGFYAINGNVRLLVKNKAEPAGTWLRLNETQKGRTVREFDAEDRSILLDADGNQVRLSLVTLDSNSTPMPVNGQPTVTNRQPGTVGSTRTVPPRRTVVRRGSEPNASTPARRRVAPARPQWLQDRLDAQAARRTGTGQNSQIDPTQPGALVTPGPPPTMLPPTPPPSGPPPVLPDFLFQGAPPSPDGSGTFQDPGQMQDGPNNPFSQDPNLPFGASEEPQLPPPFGPGG